MYEFRGTKGLTLAANAKKKKKGTKSEVTSQINDNDSSFGSVMFRSQLNQKLTKKGGNRFTTKNFAGIRI
jgi:predicted acetyltransferase